MKTRTIIALLSVVGLAIGGLFVFRRIQMRAALGISDESDPAFIGPPRPPAVELGTLASFDGKTATKMIA